MFLRQLANVHPDIPRHLLLWELHFSYGWLWNSPQLLILFKQENYAVDQCSIYLHFVPSITSKVNLALAGKKPLLNSWALLDFIQILPRRRKRLSTTLSPHFFIDTCKRYLYLKLLRQIIFQGNRYENPCTWLKGASWVCHCRLLLQWNISISNKIA